MIFNLFLSDFFKKKKEKAYLDPLSKVQWFLGGCFENAAVWQWELWLRVKGEQKHKKKKTIFLTIRFYS